METKSKSTGEPLFPSWRRMLERAAERLGRENKASYGNLVRSLIEIDPPNFLQAAKYAKDGLGPIWFDFLKEQFDHRREMAVDETLDLARAVWTLGSNLVVTTNYERVLRWTCPEQEDVGLWSIEAPAEQAAALRDGLRRPVIWHLHGHIDDAANIILTPDGYERLYPSATTHNRFSAALETLRSLLASRSFLFVGFSLNDEAFGLQLKAISDVFAGSTGPHYALIHANSVDAVRAQSLPGIELITFLDYGAPLLNLVRSLSQEVTSTPVPSTYATFTVAKEPTAELAVKIPVQDAFDDTCDTPPPTTHWVGRKEELDLLRDRNSKVIAITGIGGQGKSTLAAKYLAEIDADGMFWDWRDCKEESNTLHTHIVRIIERVTKGQRRAADLAAEKTESVIKLFLNLTLSIRGVFVFDNIDQYVDVYRSKAVEAMHALIDGAIKSAGGCKFVFTARPKLLYEQPTFLQLELDGLTAEEARQLFLARGLTVDPRYVDEVHDLTQGHPLWISLIAMQVLTNRVELAELIGRIRAGKDAGLPSAMLQEIWRSLKPKHQKLLRYLAEMVRPETEKQLAQYVAKELNFNQFTKALRQLRALDLVVVKAPSNAPDTIELHPLLREFVRRQFSQSERSPYISAIIVFFDQIIVKFRSSLAKDVPYDVLQNWTAKVELLINGGDYEQALSVLDEIRRPLLRSGYAEEFVRLAIALFTDFQLSESAVPDQKVHDDVFKDLVEVLAQLGRFAEAEDYIRRFEQTVAGATVRYVALCEMRTYFYWTRGDLELAKEWGKRGGEVKSAGNLDTRHDCGHNLALAQRDSGEVEPALIYFLGGAKIEDVVDPNAIDKTRGGSYYGNIGRCLFIKGDDVGAESCLIKSAWLLEKAQDQLVLLNQGWAAHWLAELFERRNPELAYVFYRRAASRWKLVSPPRAENALGAADRVVKKVSSQVVALADWQVDRKYLDWLDKSRRFRES